MRKLAKQLFHKKFWESAAWERSLLFFFFFFLIIKNCFLGIQKYTLNTQGRLKSEAPSLTNASC